MSRTHEVSPKGFQYPSHDHTGTQGCELSEYIATKIDEIHE